MGRAPAAMSSPAQFLSALSFSDIVIVLVAISVVTYTVSWLRWRARTRGLPLPPGPWSLPWIGNVLYMSRPNLWEENAELHKRYGEVVWVPVLGQNTVSLGSAQAISDLLDKRSAVTSDRQQNDLISLAGHNFNITFLPYGSWWRRHRQAFTRAFPASLNASHLDVQRKSAHGFLRDALANPSRLIEHIRFAFSYSIVKATYGLEIKSKNDRNVALMESVLAGLQAFTPGRTLVQYIPILKYVPFWTPVAGPQLKELQSRRSDAVEVLSTLFDQTQQQGEGHDSVLNRILEKAKVGTNLEEAVDIAKNVGLTAFIGGADTSFATLQFFLNAMYLFPEVQKKAQAELDAVVGPNRLPTHADKDSLPYLSAVVKEALRWQNVTPFAAPHHTTEDLEYKGYFIPKGTVLLPQTWVCLHDPETWPEPERFDPERFLRDGKLDPDAQDPGAFAFGYGRRICPGRFFAESGLFIYFAMALHVYNITPPLDANGNEIKADPGLAGTFLLYPATCCPTLKPRSAQAEALILAADDA
ncbi:O-methylsterigmatocystin oxidoreductase [Daedaleopsis nitida]|nr:O-methylsterigmatocystin oxidoreductase [Daedaleopsis nitida]